MTISMQNHPCIYIVVTCTGTSVARAIRVVTKMPYSHASLAATPQLHELYSFARSFKRIPLPATFNTEYIGEGTLGKFPSIPCEIYALPVSDAQYEKFLQLIDHFQACRKQYSYSLMGLLRVKMQIERDLERKFVCSQFVAYVLHECGISLEKAPSLYSPDDLRFLPQARLIFRGELNNYYREQSESNYAPLIHSAV